MYRTQIAIDPEMLAGQLCLIFWLSISVGILLETGTVRAEYGFGALYVV